MKTLYCTNVALTFGLDKNGNRIVTVKVKNSRAFSIQTNNGIMKHCNSEAVSGEICLNEISNYVKKYGTKKQKETIYGYM